MWWCWLFYYCRKPSHLIMYEPLTPLKTVRFKNEVQVRTISDEDRRGHWHFMAVDRHRFHNWIKHHVEPVLNGMLLKKQMAIHMFPNCAPAMYYLSHSLARYQLYRQPPCCYADPEDADDEGEKKVVDSGGRDSGVKTFVGSGSGDSGGKRHDSSSYHSSSSSSDSNSSSSSSEEEEEEEEEKDKRQEDEDEEDDDGIVFL
ncbi:protein ORF48 [Lake sturgeon herpesvirus]|nr:protein ORF48 [Lake sturgeon herpesvirus]